MPIYEYECKKCSLRFEVRKHFGEEDEATPCPQCQGDSRRLFSPVPIIFKGPGFYVTDSRNDNCGSLSDKGDGDESNSKKELETKKP
jgi:putative FmdB family regulatory protein